MKRTYIVTALLVSAVSLGWIWTQSKSSDPMVASSKLAVVDTVSGKLQGFIHNGTYTYRGIPYAKAAYALAQKVSMAWINFAHYGNPNHKGLPNWPAFTSANGATMIFDNTCVVRNHHDKELMSLLAPDMK